MGESRMLRSCRDHAADYRLRRKVIRTCGGMSPIAGVRHGDHGPLNQSLRIKHLLLAAGQQAGPRAPAKLHHRNIVPHI